MQKFEDRPAGEGDAEHHRHVGEAEPAVDLHLHAGEEPGGGDPAGLFRKPFPAGVEEQHGERGAGEHGVQARPGFADTEERVAGAHQPVDEHRLVEAVVAVEVRHDPLVPVHHLDGRLRETRLVAVDERQRGGARKQQQQREQEDRRQRPAPEHFDHEALRSPGRARRRAVSAAISAPSAPSVAPPAMSDG